MMKKIQLKEKNEFTGKEVRDGRKRQRVNIKNMRRERNNWRICLYTSGRMSQG